MLNIKTAKTAELVAFYNEHADKPVKKFVDRATAEKRVAALIATLAPAKKATKQGAGSAEHRAKKIRVLVKGNPKFGTAAVRFELYKTGMTVGEYVAAGGQVRDVCWDAKQGWISLQ